MARRKPEKLVIAEDPKDFTYIEIDPLDHNAIMKFLDDHQGLTTGELGVLCNRSSETIRCWKHLVKSKMKKNPFKRNHAKGKITEIPKVTDRAIWNNKEWFYNQYVTLGRGKTVISRIIGIKRGYVACKLRRYGIKMREHSDVVRSKNPCCCEAWLYFHYANHEEYVEWCNKNNIVPNECGGRALGLVACAKMAKVVPYTIFNWLIKFKLHIRDMGEASINMHRKLKKLNKDVNAKHLLGKTQGQHTTISA